MKDPHQGERRGHLKGGLGPFHDARASDWSVYRPRILPSKAGSVHQTAPATAQILRPGGFSTGLTSVITSGEGRIELVLFDLGGVLGRLGSLSAMYRLAGTGSDEELSSITS